VISGFHREVDESRVLNVPVLHEILYEVHTLLTLVNLIQN